MEKKGKQLIFSLMFLFLIGFVQAELSIASLPTTLSLNCGESYYETFYLSSGINNTIIPATLSSNLGYMMGITPTVYQNGYPTKMHLSFFQTTACSTGSSTFTFNLNGETKSVILEVSEDLWNLGSISVSKGKRIDIGNIAHLGILEVSDTQVQYILSGCGTTEQGLLLEGNLLEAVCAGKSVEINLKNSYGDPFNFAEFEIFSSEAGLILTSSNETVVDSSECELGLDTLGAKVKRGNIFAIKTINANTGKFVDSVSVTILDQQGELSPIAGLSSNIGFFSERLHEEYEQDIIVQLEKEGCEPSTQVILFENSYDDYKKAKQEEEGAYQLVLNMSGRFVMNTAITKIVKNALDEVVEGVKVKITKPDNSVFEVLTNSLGSFSFTPNVVGNWKIQGGLDDYESTQLSEIKVYQNKQYLVVIKVNGEQSSDSTYKKGQKLSFELRNENNTLIPLTINNATFAGLPLRFISGISDQVIFEDSCTLVVPSINGYKSQTISLSKKVNNWTTWIYWIGIIFGIIIGFVVIALIIRKVKGGGKPKQNMEIQLGGGD